LAAAAARLVHCSLFIIILAEEEEEARESLDFVMCLEKLMALFGSPSTLAVVEYLAASLVVI
jgi:hypothetical protein